MELYSSARPEACLGCGGGITAGDVVVPAERGWLLCLDCGAGLLIGQSLPAWPGAEAVPHPSSGTGDGAGSGLQALAATQADPGSEPGQGRPMFKGA